MFQMEIYFSHLIHKEMNHSIQFYFRFKKVYFRFKVDQNRTEKDVENWVQQPHMHSFVWGQNIHVVE